MVVNNVVLLLGVKEVSAACVKEESTKNKCRITHFRATHWSVEMYYSYYALIGEWTALLLSSIIKIFLLMNCVIRSQKMEIAEKANRNRFWIENRFESSNDGILRSYSPGMHSHLFGWYMWKNGGRRRLHLFFLCDIVGTKTFFCSGEIFWDGLK